MQYGSRRYNRFAVHITMTEVYEQYSRRERQAPKARELRRRKASCKDGCMCASSQFFTFLAMVHFGTLWGLSGRLFNVSVRRVKKLKQIRRSRDIRGLRFRAFPSDSNTVYECRYDWNNLTDITIGTYLTES